MSAMHDATSCRRRTVGRLHIIMIRGRLSLSCKYMHIQYTAYMQSDSISHAATFSRAEARVTGRITYSERGGAL